VLAVALALVLPALAGQTLYNGVVLPDTWPPPDSQTGALNAISNHLPMPVPPWLLSPPAVIPIDVGRQLFLPVSMQGDPDINREFLVDSMSNLTRTWHYGDYYAGNPVLQNVLPFSDGIWWDPQAQIYKLYVHDGADATGFGLYTSPDALHWTWKAAPTGDGIGITYINSDAVWLDLEETNPAKRWKAMWVIGSQLFIRFSADGIAFVQGRLEPGNWGNTDRDTLFLNPFRQRFVWSIRGGAAGQDRMRFYSETTRDLFGTSSQGAISDCFNHPWLGSDNLDPLWPTSTYVCSLYNFDSTPYESLMLGYFSIWGGPAGIDGRYDKINQVYLGFSYDGWYYFRPAPRTPLCPISTTPGTWNWANVQSVVGSPLIVGPADQEQLYFYSSGRGLQPYTDFAMGMRYLRRDGFCSMDAGATEGTLTTHPVKFSGRYMFVNVADPNGNLLVELLDANGQVIAPFSKANCQPIAIDKTLRQVRWNSGADLWALANQPVKVKFYLTNGSLYSFWVTAAATGASNGYVGGGGSRYTSNKDTVGLGFVPNQPPTVTAGPDSKVMMPNALSLDGTISDDGLPSPPAACTVTWSQVLGPGGVIFANPAAASTTAIFSVAGTYILRLTASDSSLSSSSDLTVTVLSPGDFNGDGRVNGADFLIWQAHYPTASGATPDTGDANGDGMVNGADFLIWQENYKPM
jgi:hypothetical protein